MREEVKGGQVWRCPRRPISVTFRPHTFLSCLCLQMDMQFGTALDAWGERDESKAPDGPLPLPKLFNPFAR